MTYEQVLTEATPAGREADLPCLRLLPLCTAVIICYSDALGPEHELQQAHISGELFKTVRPNRYLSETHLI